MKNRKKAPKKTREEMLALAEKLLNPRGSFVWFVCFDEHRSRDASGAELEAYANQRLERLRAMPDAKLERALVGLEREDLLVQAAGLLEVGGWSWDRAENRPHCERVMARLRRLGLGDLRREVEAYRARVT